MGNLIQELRGEETWSTGSLINDTAMIAAPGNQTAQNVASIADLGIDFASGRVSARAISPDLYTKYGIRMLQGGGQMGKVWTGFADDGINVMSHFDVLDKDIQVFKQFGGK